MADRPAAYCGSNFGRLRKIKAKYDPYNVFQYEQSIPPASGPPHVATPAHPTGAVSGGELSCVGYPAAERAALLPGS
jgi:Berberine and berberine like